MQTKLNVIEPKPGLGAFYSTQPWTESSLAKSSQDLRRAKDALINVSMVVKTIIHNSSQ